MKSSTMLRWCLALELVFILVGVALSSALESSLPEPLAAWLQAESERDLTSGEIALFAVFVPLILTAIAATVGLFCLRRWAAWLYLFTCLLGVVLMPLTGPTVEHAIPDAFDEAALVLSGMVVALAFFTDSLKRGGAEQNPPPLPRDPQTGHSDGEG